MNTTFKIAAILSLLGGFCLSTNAQDGGKKIVKESELTKRDTKLHKGMRRDAKMEKRTMPDAAKMETKEARERKKVEKMEVKGKM